jgi:N-acetyl-anhydromuramyl-L-alanine amidase AmpD
MKTWHNDIYCDAFQSEFYDQVSFQGYNYFATFTAAQYESLIILLRYLTAQFNIARKILPDDFRYIAFDEVVDFNGIVSHLNYRTTGKQDIGPAFDWERIISGLR